MPTTPAAPSLIEKIRGKRTADITLPNESGEIDDRVLEDEERRTWNPLKRMAVRTKRLSQRAKRSTARR